MQSKRAAWRGLAWKGLVGVVVAGLLVLHARIALAADEAERWLHLIEPARQAHLRGEFQVAEKGYLEALRLAEQFDSQGKFLEATLSDLAGLYFIEGRYAEAATYYHQALPMAEALYDPKDPKLAIYRENLADAQAKAADAPKVVARAAPGGPLPTLNMPSLNPARRDAPAPGLVGKGPERTAPPTLAEQAAGTFFGEPAATPVEGFFPAPPPHEPVPAVQPLKAVVPPPPVPPKPPVTTFYFPPGVPQRGQMPPQDAATAEAPPVREIAPPRVAAFYFPPGVPQRGQMPPDLPPPPRSVTSALPPKPSPSPAAPSLDAASLDVAAGPPATPAETVEVAPQVVQAAVTEAGPAPVPGAVLRAVVLPDAVVGSLIDPEAVAEEGPGPLVRLASLGDVRLEAPVPAMAGTPGDPPVRVAASELPAAIPVTLSDPVATPVSASADDIAVDVSSAASPAAAVPPAEAADTAAPEAPYAPEQEVADLPGEDAPLREPGWGPKLASYQPGELGLDVGSAIDMEAPDQKAPFLAEPTLVVRITPDAQVNKTKGAAPRLQPFQQVGNLEDTAHAYERNADDTKRQMGPRSNEYAVSLYNLARLYQRQGRYTQARALFENALEIQEDALPENHPDLLATLKAYAWLLRASGFRAKAERLLDRVKAAEGGAG